MDLRRYSSSSTVPLRPDPTFRSAFRLDRELRLKIKGHGKPPPNMIEPTLMTLMLLLGQQYSE